MPPSLINLCWRLIIDTLSPHVSKDNPETTFIYALLDPDTNEIRYVGKSDDPQRRLLEHLRDKAEYYKARWIRRLRLHGKTPRLLILEEVSVAQWQERECHWIAFYQAKDCRLTNSAPGGMGNGSYVRTAETRAKVAASNRRRAISAETRAKISASLTGKRQSPEVIAKRAAKQRNPSPETRAKFSARSRGRTFSPETRAKISAAMRGKKRGEFSEEWRRNLGNATRGKKQSPEVIEKRVASRRGRKLSDETKAKISASNRGKLKGTKRPPRSEEWCQKISESKKGKKPLEETKAKQAASRRGLKRSEETRAKMAESARQAHARRKAAQISEA